jgi:hypothetical protein
VRTVRANTSELETTLRGAGLPISSKCNQANQDQSTMDAPSEEEHSARVFSSAEAFLSSDCVDETSCLILDVMMP